MSESNPSFLKLKAGDAPKLGRNGGSISYVVLADAERRELFISVVSNNSGSGCWSTEAVPLEAIERCLPLDRAQAFSAKALMASFRGKSVNNGSFLCAALKVERLIGPAEGKPNQYQVAGDWPAWKAGMLALAGEPYALPSKAGMAARATATDAPETASLASAPSKAAGKVEASDARSPKKGRKGHAGEEGNDAPAA